MTARPTTAYNFTIDDASPLIKYEPANLWDDNVTPDVNLPRYFRESYHYSINATAKASLTFTGTGVWVFGGRRSISGAYSVQIDNQPAQSFPANPEGVVDYQAPLGGANGLPFGEHTIVVTNLSTDEQQPVLDIDAFLIETAAGNGSGETYSGPIVIDDADGQNAGITYSANGWATASQVATAGTEWMKGTVHESNVNGASVEFSFEGQGLGIMGAVGPKNGNFRVEMDGKDMGEMTAKASIFHPSTPIWFASNLSAGQHKVKVTNTGSNGDALTIDSYQVFKSTPSNGSPSGTSASTSPTPSTGEGNVTFSRAPNIPLPVIIGCAVGGVVLLGLLAFGILLYIRMRKKIVSIHQGNITSFNQPPPTSVMAQLPTARVDSRSSAATAVDVEAGLVATEKGEKGEKSTGWLGTIRRPTKDKNSEPSTPPLPLQNYAPSPSTHLPPGPNPILGIGGYVPTSNSAGYLIPSGSRPAPAAAPSIAPSPSPAPPVIPAVAISSPRTPGPPPQTPLPPPPVVLGMPPRGRQQANAKHGRAPSLGATVSGPSRSRSLTSHEIRRSRSAQTMKAQAEMEMNSDVLLPPSSNRFNPSQARESHQSLGFDLSAYTDPLTPVEARHTPTIPAVPSIPREYAPYASGPSSTRSSLDSQRSGGQSGGQRRRPGMI